MNSVTQGMKRCDGSPESLARLSRPPRSHPNRHTEAEIRLMALKPRILGKR